MASSEGRKPVCCDHGSVMTHRNRIILAVLAIVAVSSAAVASSTRWSSAHPGAVPLVSGMTWSSPPTRAPALDTPIDLRRALTPAEANAGAGYTHSLVGLMLENRTGSALGYPWLMHAELDTDHALGADGVILHTRLYSRGSGWAAAFHTDSQALGSGTTIGVNIEASTASSARNIGVNIQAKSRSQEGSTAGWLSQAINVQTDPGVGVDSGVQFDGARMNTGIRFTSGSTSQRAIWIEGTHAVGVDVGANPIRMNAGTPIQLESTGTITMRYNPATYRIEFCYGTRVLGYLVTDASAGGRMN